MTSGEALRLLRESRDGLRIFAPGEVEQLAAMGGAAAHCARRGGEMAGGAVSTMTLFDLATIDAPPAPPVRVPDGVHRVATVFYWCNDSGLWRRHDPDSAPVWAVRSVAEALDSMARGMAGLVRAEDAAAVDAWLAGQGATVQAVGG